MESVALEQTALSHILNAEGEKLQKLLSLDGIGIAEVLLGNKSVDDMVVSVTKLEALLRMKLDLFGDCICDKE